MITIDVWAVLATAALWLFSGSVVFVLVVVGTNARRPSAVSIGTLIIVLGLAVIGLASLLQPALG